MRIIKIMIEMPHLPGKRGLDGKGAYMEAMTDKQFKTILEMVDMILDGCKDLEEAKKKVQKLIENQSNKNKDE